MLRTIKTLARIHSLNEESLKKSIEKNNYNLIKFKDDFLVHPWTFKEIKEIFLKEISKK